MPTFLIIDDLQESRAFAAQALRQGVEDCCLLEADSGRAGLELAANHADQIDVVVLDASMPGMDGFEVCRTLRENAATTKLPVLMLSAVFVDSSDRVRGLHSGADAYLCKPFHFEELASLVKVLMQATGCPVCSNNLASTSNSV